MQRESKTVHWQSKKCQAYTEQQLAPQLTKSAIESNNSEKHEQFLRKGKATVSTSNRIVNNGWLIQTKELRAERRNVQPRTIGGN